MPLFMHTSTMPPAREACIASAVAYYARPTDPVSPAGLSDIVHAIIRVEGGTTGQIHWNNPDAKGERSYDMGLMQINSSHLSELTELGATQRDVTNNECLNIFVGTWILKRSIAASPNLWTAIGNYNTGSLNPKTVAANYRYISKVWAQLQRLWHGE